MDNKLIYIIGPSTAGDMERLRQLLPGADIELLPYPGKEKISIKPGATGVVVLDDYIGTGKELLLMRSLKFRFSRVMGLNEEGELI